MMGAVNAEGPALIFMDSHIEVTVGWIEPLLDRLAFNKNITAISVVDTLDMETLAMWYREDPNKYPVTGFNWDLMFNWREVPDFERKRMKNPNDPIRSPTMLGKSLVLHELLLKIMFSFNSRSLLCY